MNRETWPVHNLASAAVSSMAKWERKEADLYPTPEDATQALLIAAPPPPGLVYEPACGEGKMARVLKANGYEVMASDIRDTGYGEPHIDFRRWRGRVPAIVTNPPFVYAEDFIRVAVAQADYVALLLKSNFFNTGGRQTLWRHFTPAKVLPVTWRIAFLEEERGKSPLMDCNWYVWIRGQKIDGMEPLPRPKTYPKFDDPLSVLLAKNREAREKLERALHGGRIGA